MNGGTHSMIGLAVFIIVMTLWPVLLVFLTRGLRD
jgi:hypothetical protein